MAWLRIDDTLTTHEKFVGIGAGAAWLWLQMAVYAARHRTDGMIHGRVIRSFAHRARDLKELVERDLVKKHSDGAYEIVNYLKWNDSREVIEHREEQTRRNRQADNERKRAFRAASVRQMSDRTSGGHPTGQGMDVRAPSGGRSSDVLHTPLPYPNPDPDLSETKTLPRPPVASSRAHARAQAREADVPSMSQAPDNGTVTKRNTTSHDVTERRTTSHAVEPPAQAPAQKAGGQAAAGDLEAELRKLLEADRYYRNLTGTNAQELAQRLADNITIDAKKPAHVIAAVRRALDLAAASSYNAATTNKSILAFAQRASEADMAQSLPARPGRPGLAAAEPRPITTKATGMPEIKVTEEDRRQTEEMFRFRRACGWTPLQPWPLPAMVAAGWVEGMPWPLTQPDGDKASPRPLSGPATAKAVASEAS